MKISNFSEIIAKIPEAYRNKDFAEVISCFIGRNISKMLKGKELEKFALENPGLLNEILSQWAALKNY
jgi:hypothetical protein